MNSPYLLGIYSKHWSFLTDTELPFHWSIFHTTPEINAPPYNKYLSQTDSFCKRALRYGYTSKYTPIADVIRIKDRLLWDKITTDSTQPLHELLPPQRSRRLRIKRFLYILPRVIIACHKRCFVNRCVFNFSLLLSKHSCN